MKPNTLFIILLLFVSGAFFASCNENSCDSEKTVISKTLTLNSPETIIDMTLSTKYPSAFSADTGNIVSLYYWTHLGVVEQAKICMKFDLSTISQTAIIITAKVTSYEGNTAFNPSDAIYLYKITEPWDAYTTNWNNPPNYSKTEYILDPKDPDDTNLKVEFDITSFVKDWVKDPSKNYGLIMELVDQRLYHGYNFYSSNEVDQTKRLKVVIEYEE